MNMLRNIGPARLAMLAATAAVLIGFFVFLGMKVTQPKMVLLYGNLDLQSSAEIVTRLEAQKIPYQIAANGAQILVPEDRKLRVSMQLAETRLPAVGSAGYELFAQANTLPDTKFTQKQNKVP